jgi:hypothetical protein
MSPTIGSRGTKKCLGELEVFFPGDRVQEPGCKRTPVAVTPVQDAKGNRERGAHVEQALERHRTGRQGLLQQAPAGFVEDEGRPAVHASRAWKHSAGGLTLMAERRRVGASAVVPAGMRLLRRPVGVGIAAGVAFVEPDAGADGSFGASIDCKRDKSVLPSSRNEDGHRRSPYGLEIGVSRYHQFRLVHLRGNRRVPIRREHRNPGPCDSFSTRCFVGDSDRLAQEVLWV